jgi:hypothetical protein
VGFPPAWLWIDRNQRRGCGNFTENYLAKPSSTGPATKPLVDLAIFDDDGNAMPQGERARSASGQLPISMAIGNNDEATAAAFTSDGYFRTGDIGYLDEDGYLFIVDRKKDIIIRGGENISCPEVEAAAYEHDAIAELSVFGIADDRYGEVPGIVYFTKDGEELSPDELKAFLQAKLAPFKVPVHFWRVHDPLPRLGTQKIDRVTLRREYNAEGASVRTITFRSRNASSKRSSMSGKTRSKGRQRDIIDRAKVAELVARLPRRRRRKGSAQSSRGIADGVAGWQEEIARRLVAHPSLGRSCANDQAFLIDQIVRIAYDLSAPPCIRWPTAPLPRRIAVVAVGGYGRGEMAPHSDVDIAFITRL